MVTQILKNINAHRLQYLPGIFFAFPGRGGVIRTQCLGGIAHGREIVGQNPSGYQYIHARVIQVLLLQSMPTQQGKPGRIDLHESNVAGAVVVQMHHCGLPARLLSGDGAQQRSRHVVAHRGFFEAMGLGLLLNSRDNQQQPSNPCADSRWIHGYKFGFLTNTQVALTFVVG